MDLAYRSPEGPTAETGPPAPEGVGPRAGLLPIVLAAGAGVLLSTLGFLGVGAWERHLAVEMRRADFERAADERSGAVRRELRRALDASLDLAAFIKVNQSAERLKNFAVHRLVHDPAVRAVAWVPKLDDALNPTDPLSGAPLQLAIDPAAAANGSGIRFPLLFQLVMSEREPPSGKDIATLPLYRAAMDLAVSQGVPAVTRPVPVTGPGLPGYDVATLVPIFRNGGTPSVTVERDRQLAGFLLAGLSVDTLVTRALAGDRQQLRVWLADITDAGTPEVLYRPFGARGGLPGADAATTPWRFEKQFEAGGRRWNVVAFPAPGGFVQPFSANRWLALGGGTALTLILVWYMMALRRQALVLTETNAALNHEIGERQRSEAALRASESRFRKVLETAADAIVIVDADARIVIANTAAETLFGYRKEELLGLKVHDLVPPSHKQAHRQYEKDYLADPDPQGMAAERELSACRRDGSTVPVEINLSPLRAPDGLFVTAIIRDVSERKQAEERVRWLARFPADNPNPVMRLSQAGEVVYANEASMPLLRHWQCGVGQPLPTKLRARVADAVKTTKVQEAEVEFGPRLFLLTIAPVNDAEFINLYALDITERREAERTRERLSAILEATTDFVGIMEAAEQRVLYINRAGTRLLGLERPEAWQGLHGGDCLTETSRALVKAEGMPTAIRDGYWTGELYLAAGDCSVPASVVLIAHKDPDGRVRSFSMVARDVSEAKHKEEHLRRLNRTHAVLSACNHALVRAGSEEELLDAFCHNIAEIGGYPCAWVGFRQVDSLAIASLAGRTDLITNAKLIDPEGLPEAAARSGEAITAREGSALWADSASRLGLQAAISLPLASERGVFGTLTIYASEPDVFDADEVALLKELAGDLAFGVQSLRTGRAFSEAEAGLMLRNRALEVSRNGVMLCDAADPALPMIYVNPAFERITGYRLKEVLGRNPVFLQGDDRDQPDRARLRSAINHGKDGTATLRNYRKDGSLFWNELFIAPVFDESGTLTHYVGIINDITERKRYQEQLEYQAQHDQLTGLPNRNLMQDRLEQALVYARRYHRTAAVLFLDIDHFKVINDTLGHGIGDQLLRVVAARLQDSARQGDTVARYGGDEFVLLLPDLEWIEDVNRLADRILTSVARPMEIDGHRLQVTVSIGATLFPRDGEDSVALLKNADAAMYRTKELGRNSIHFFTEDLNSRLMERLTLERQLRRAIEEQELRLYYQPQVEVTTGQLVGLEALVRWEHPELGLVSPTRFITLAEETGLILLLGERVLQKACEQLAAWRQQGLPRVAVAVNVSARQLADDLFVDKLERLLQQTGVEPEALELELTESSVMDDPLEMLGRIRRLKELGVTIAIDDFGTGYSSLSHLKRFPFDKLKIDQSFVRDITSDPDDAAIALAVIGIAKSLKLRVIAEGVETEGQLRYLMHNGCDEVQGFLFGRPQPAEELTGLLASNTRFPLPRPPNDAAFLLVAAEPSRARALTGDLDADGHRILVARDAAQAFEYLAQHPVDAIIVDRQLPGMPVIDFLLRAGELHVDIPRLLVTGSDAAVPPGLADVVLVRPSGETLRRTVAEALRREEQVLTD